MHGFLRNLRGTILLLSRLLGDHFLLMENLWTKGITHICAKASDGFFNAEFQGQCHTRRKKLRAKEKEALKGPHYLFGHGIFRGANLLRPMRWTETHVFGECIFRIFD